MAVEVRNFLETLDCGCHVARIECIAAAHEQSVAVARIERDHALQNFFRRTELALGPQSLGCRREDLPGFCLLAEADINLGQPCPHGNVFGIHFQSLLEDPYCLFQLTFTQKFFRHLQILSAGIIEKTLLGIKFGQPEHALQRRLQLAQLLVHGNRFDGEALRSVSVANTLEAFHGLFGIAETRVEVAHGIHYREILGVGFENFFVLSNCVWQLALLDKLLRSTENLLLVEAKTKRHKNADSSSGFVSRPKTFSTTREYVPKLTIPSAIAPGIRDGL